MPASFIILFLVACLFSVVSDYRNGKIYNAAFFVMFVSVIGQFAYEWSIGSVSESFLLRFGAFAATVAFISLWGPLNATYVKFILLCGAFAAVSAREFAFIGNLFLFVLSYLLIGTTIFYGAFLANSEKRKTFFLHFRKRYWRRKRLKKSAFQLIFPIITLACLLFFLKIAFFYLEPSIVSVFWEELSEKYATVLYFAISLLFFRLGNIFYFRMLGKWKHAPFGLFGLLAALVSFDFVITWGRETLMAERALFSILLILPIFSVVQKAVSFFLETQSTKTVTYSKLSPGDMVDTEFLEKRFGFDPGLLITSTSGRISEGESQALKNRISHSLEESPWIAPEVRLYKRFVLSPYIVSAFVSAFVFGGLLQKSFALLRSLP